MTMRSSAHRVCPSRRHLLRWGGGAVAACALAGLMGGRVWARSQIAQGAMQSVRIRTALSWIPNHSFAGIWIALDKGYFAEQGIAMEWRPGGPNTPNPVERVASGEVDIGMQANPRPVFEAITKGNDFVILGTVYQRNPSGLLSLAKTPIREAKDVVGKRVLCPTPTDARTVETMLKLNKLSTSFTFVPAGFDPQALLDGQGDAMIAFVTNQVVALERRGMVKEKDFFHRSWGDLGLPGYSTFIFAKRGWVESNRAAVMRYLRAQIRGWQENEKDPAYAAKLVTEKYGADFGLDLARETRSNQLQTPFLHGPDTAANGLLWINRDLLRGPMYTALREGGVESLPDVDKVVDVSILKEAHGR